MYKYGLTFSQTLNYVYPKGLQQAYKVNPLTNDGYLAFAFYSKPISITDEKVYHLEYIGRVSR